MISALAIGKLIESHMDGDNDKFIAYAKFIADEYELEENVRAAKIIRNKLAGKKSSVVVLQNQESQK
jgi:hypothetical protein